MKRAVSARKAEMTTRLCLDIDGSRLVRILLIVSLILLSGCTRHAVRESQVDDNSDDHKSEIRQLEDRLGV